MSFRQRFILSGLFAGFFLTAFLLPIGIAAPQETPLEPLPPGVVVETVVASARQVVALDFTPDGRLLYTERVSDFSGGTYRGWVRVVQNGQLITTAAYAFPVLHEGERGLLGIAVDPNFAANHYVWVYFSRYSAQTDCGGNYKNRVVRFELNDNNTVTADPVTMGCYPIVSQYETIHNGGNLHFGPDGKLYIAVGNNDSTNDGVDPAQNLGSPLGKLHRVNPEWQLPAPSDNPFPGSTIYAYGLRNSFDFDFDPVTGQIFATENGDACDDEVNRLLPGGNYGWRPNYPCDDATGPNPAYNTLPPLIHWTPSIAPTGLTFYTGDLIPEWKNDLFICAFKDSSTALHHFKLNAARTAIVSHTIISGTQCRTDVLTGPDGALYYAEGGGYTNGPLKRLTRRAVFSFSQVGVSPSGVSAGEVFTYHIQLKNVGTLSSTFRLTATLSPHTLVKALSPGLTAQPGGVTWADRVEAMQTLTGAIAVTVADLLTTPYAITTPFTITAPALPPVLLSTTTIVNGFPIFLPIIRR